MEKINREELRDGNHIILVGDKDELSLLKKKGVNVRRDVLSSNKIDLDNPQSYPLLVIPTSGTIYRWYKLNEFLGSPRKIIKVHHIGDTYILNKFQYEAFKTLSALGATVFQTSKDTEGKTNNLMQRCIEFNDVNNFKLMDSWNIAGVLNNCIVLED